MIYGIEKFCWETNDDKDIENLNFLSLNDADRLYGCVFGALVADACAAYVENRENLDH